jgi:hypothetical protein
MQDLLDVLGLETWSLEFAAWVFTGSSSINQEEPLVVRRLYDGYEVVHGSEEYRQSEKEFLRTLELFDQHLQMTDIISREPEGNINPRKNSYPRNWLIHQVANVWPRTERINIPWLEHAHDLGLIPSYIVQRLPWIKEFGDNSKLFYLSDNTSRPIQIPYYLSGLVCIR